MRGRQTDIATSRAFVPPWSLAGALNKVSGKTGLLSDQTSRAIEPRDRNPSDPEDDANCFAPLAALLSE